MSSICIWQDRSQVFEITSETCSELRIYFVLNLTNLNKLLPLLR